MLGVEDKNEMGRLRESLRLHQAHMDPVYQQLGAVMAASGTPQGRKVTALADRTLRYDEETRRAKIEQETHSRRIKYAAENNSCILTGLVEGLPKYHMSKSQDLSESFCWFTVGSNELHRAKIIQSRTIWASIFNYDQPLKSLPWRMRPFFVIGRNDTARSALLTPARMQDSTNQESVYEGHFVSEPAKRLNNVSVYEVALGAISYRMMGRRIALGAFDFYSPDELELMHDQVSGNYVVSYSSPGSMHLTSRLSPSFIGRSNALRRRGSWIVPALSDEVCRDFKVAEHLQGLAIAFGQAERLDAAYVEIFRDQKRQRVAETSQRQYAICFAR